MRLSSFVVAMAFAAFLPGIAGAHEHMYIASTAPNGGALVLDYDFARPFPLAELPNQPGTWIGVDPSFNSLVADDAGRSLYRLKTGTKVTMEIVAIDAPVSIELGGKTLAHVGNRAVVGTMPYLHVHPQWTVTLPVGTTGTGRVTFHVKAPGYTASPDYVGTLDATPPTTTTSTTTTTTTVEGQTTTTGLETTTTTTLPFCDSASCNDADACTADLCDGPICTHTPLTAADAVLCRLRKFQDVLDRQQPADRQGKRTLGKLYKAALKARDATQSARATPTARRLKQAGNRLSHLTTVVDAADRGGHLDAGALTQLSEFASTSYDAFTLWQQTAP